MNDCTKKRVAVYVDGFNLYHAIDDWAKKQTPEDHTLKWLDIRALAKNLCLSEEKLVSVRYFSATGEISSSQIRKRMRKSTKTGRICDHKYYGCKNHFDLVNEINNRFKESKDGSKRHDSYTDALKNLKIKCDISKFGTSTILCRCCGKIYLDHTEKQTDVKIALRIVNDVYKNRFDVLILVSADSDFFPIIKDIVRRHKKESRIAVSDLPSKKTSRKGQLENTIKIQEPDLYKKIKIVPISEELLRQCQLPDVISIGDGKEIHRPDKYRNLPSPPTSHAAS